MMILYLLQSAESLSSNPPPQDAAGMIFQIIIGFVGGTAGTTLISKAFDVQKVKQLTKMMYELEAATKEINNLTKDLEEEKAEKAFLQAKLEELSDKQTTGITNRLTMLEMECQSLKEKNDLQERLINKAKKLLRDNNIDINRR